MIATYSVANRYISDLAPRDSETRQQLISLRDGVIDDWFRGGGLGGVLWSSIRASSSSAAHIAPSLANLISLKSRESVKGLVARVTTDASSGPVQAQNRQAAGSVLIVGVGAVGSALAWQLARLGVRLRLIDKGVLGPTNLVWHQAGTEDLGQPKAVVLADHIRERLPQCQVDGFEADYVELDVQAVQAHLAWADVVVASTDDVQVQGCISRDCMATGKPTAFPAVWVDDVSHESEAGEILWVDPRRSVMPCYECLTKARNLALAAQPGERGGYINVEALTLTLVTVVKGLINPIDPAARFLWVERSLVRVRGHEPLRPTLVDDFGEGQYVSPVDVRFPPQPCPACGQHAQPESPPEPPDMAPVGEPPGAEVPDPEWSIPLVAYARNPPDYQSDNHPTDRRAFAAAAVTGIVIVALVIVWAVLSAINRHHAAATPSGPISPTVKLVCDPHVGGTWCEDGASGSAGTIALDIVGVSYDNFYNLCNMGYKFDLTDNYGQSSGVTGNGCGGYGDVYSTSANPVTGAPYIDLKLPKYSNTDNYRCGPWALTLRIKDPSGRTIRTARYGTNLGNCSASPSPSTGTTSAPSISKYSEVP